MLYCGQLEEFSAAHSHLPIITVIWGMLFIRLYLLLVQLFSAALLSFIRKRWGEQMRDWSSSFSFQLAFWKLSIFLTSDYRIMNSETDGRAEFFITFLLYVFKWNIFHSFTVLCAWKKIIWPKFSIFKDEFSFSLTSAIFFYFFIMTMIKLFKYFLIYLWY